MEIDGILNVAAKEKDKKVHLISLTLLMVLSFLYFNLFCNNNKAIAAMATAWVSAQG